jgi:hypothetical protein
VPDGNEVGALWRSIVAGLVPNRGRVDWDMSGAGCEGAVVGGGSGAGKVAGETAGENG